MKPAARAAVVLFLALGLRADAAEPKPSGFHKHVLPLVQKYCLECHQGEKPKGELRLDEVLATLSIAAEDEVWRRVLDRVESKTMPPEDQPAPSDGERAAIIGWLAAELRRIDAETPVDPGRVTIRRLNRAEYNNTIRDLVGLDFHPADDFPRDDVGYGFDNIGDVLSLSPILLERYLAAAEQISQRAIVGDLGTLATLKRAGSQLGRKPRRDESTILPLVMNGQGSVTVDCPHDTDVTITVRAFGQAAAGEPARMTIVVDGKVRDTFDVTAEENRPGEYRTTARLAAGQHRIGAAFINDYYDPENANPNERDRNLFIERLEVRSQDGVALQKPPATHEKIIFRSPESPAESQDCAREILARFAARAFRRPVGQDEVAPLVAIARQVEEDGGTFEQSIQVAMQAVLVSPHFLFRVELDDRPLDGAEPAYIGDHALASRLSYFLWSSMPDDELLARAADGSLRRSDVLEAQVRRMLADPKADALVKNFGGQWLQTRNLEDATPNRKLYKQFTDPLRAAMLQESELFFQAVMREDRRLLDFIDADFTFLNEPLARLYGIEGVKGRELRRVALDEKHAARGGVLTMAAVLTVTSDARRTSPVKRGKWILENILGTPPPDPPPGVPTLPDEVKVKLTGTMRQQLEQHRSDPGCASCHSRMDPLGFGLENFDAIGGWRVAQEDVPIDASGELPDGERFNGPVELKKYLQSQPRDFARCLAEKMLTYALGRGLESYDRPTVNAIVDAVEAQDYKFSALIIEIVKSQPFQMRRGKE